MKILVICQYYFPEPFKIADTCEELVRLGHQVTVVTGTPNYPMGVIYSGYENGHRSDEVINGVKVHRCKTTPRGQGVINRFRNYFSFARQSKKYVKKLENDFDVVFVNQLSPVMMADAGVYYSKKHDLKLVLYCLDLWPESLCVGGIKRNSIIYKIFKRISGKIYRSADEILVSSSKFAEYLSETFKIDKNKFTHLAQYAESQFLDIPQKEQGEEFNALFAGNIGTAQDLGTVIESARILKDENIKFHVVGDGIELENLKKQAEHLSNVIFYGRRPSEEMPQFYDMADAMLITLIDDDVISMTVPAKLYTYFASGKAVVGAINGDTADILNSVQGGYAGEAGNYKLLAQNVLELKNSKLAGQIGRQNRQYYLDNLSKEKFIGKLVERLSFAKEWKNG